MKMNTILTVTHFMVSAFGHRPNLVSSAEKQEEVVKRERRLHIWLLTNEATVFDLGMDVELVLLLHLKPEVSHENIDQHGRQVVHARSQGGHQPSIERNQIHSKATHRFYRPSKHSIYVF